MPPTSVCFVVSEALGTHPFGGIATATSHAALVLAQHGYDVELLYTGPDPELEPAWAARYDDAGVRFRRLVETNPVGPSMLETSWNLYRQLVRRAPDVAVFQDWQGLGFCSGQAKRAGELGGTKLVHIVHGPTDWLREANQRQGVDAVETVMAWMERRSAQLADTVVGPSRYLLDWMRDQGWQLPEDEHVVPYFVEAHVADLDRRLPEAPDAHAVGELVFFGRLEERKGVRVFTDALNRVGAAALNEVAVTFLGRPAPLTVEQVSAMLDPEIRASVTVRFESNLDQAGARAYLRQPGRVAVMPSLLDNSPNVIYECIEDRLPFLASSTGGNAELVHPDDRADVLFRPEPDDLARALGKVLADGRCPAPARPAYDGRASLASWGSILAPAPSPAPTPTRTGADRPVAVVIAHHDGGRHVMEAVASVAAQTHERLEIVVVDDGSTDQASLDVLEAIAEQDWGRRVTVLHQENRYLGAARNAGVAATDAAYVAFCDDDDVLHPEFVEVLLETAQRTGAAAAASALRNREVGDDGEFVDGLADPIWVFLDGLPTAGTVWNTFGGAGMLVRREALLAVGGFHEQRGVGHEDWEVLARLVLAGHEVVAVPRPLYDYRIRPGSMIRTTSQYRNARRINETFADHLPVELQAWPALVRGQHVLLTEQQEEIARLTGEVERLTVELDRRTRLLELFRPHGPDRR